MSETSESPRPAHWPPEPCTVAEYHRLIAAGVLGKYDRCELIRGRLIPKPRVSPPHAYAVHGVHSRFHRIVGAEYCVRGRSAVTLADSEPEPEVAIVDESETYHIAHPGAVQVRVVVEVAGAGSELSRVDKFGLYAENGIPGYWIIDLASGWIEVYTQPTPAGYAHRRDYLPGDAVPVTIAGQALGAVPVADIIP